jgi:hypothetical protein
MPEINGQRWQERLHVQTSLMPFQQSPYGEAMAERCKARPSCEFISRLNFQVLRRSGKPTPNVVDVKRATVL